MKTLFLFIDGIGITNLTESNPFSLCRNSLLYKIIYESDPIYSCKPIDALLGVEGLPQSGTGHVTILTGKNAAIDLQKHHGPFPHTTHRDWLLNDSIGSWCNKSNKKWEVLNAYPPPYFKALGERRIRLSAFGYMQTIHGKKMYSAEDLTNNLGFPSLLTFHKLEIFGIKLPEYSPKETVQYLLGQFSNIDLGIIEYFALDHLGHDQNIDSAVARINDISQFLEELKPFQKELSVIITSDHGNIEDCSSKSHTLNPVPFITNRNFTQTVNSLVDIKSVIIESLII